MTKAMTPPVSAPTPPGKQKFQFARYQDLALVPVIIILLVIGAILSQIGRASCRERV